MMEWQLTNEQWVDKYKEFPVLSILENDRVFTIGKQADGSYGVIEGCDECFGVTLTRDQMLKLAQEIIDYVGKE